MSNRLRSRWPPAVASPTDFDRELNFQIAAATTILVVDDDPHVRALARRLLGGQAYRVREASDGITALEVAAAETGPITLVVTDVEMPRNGPRRMLRKLEELNPGLQVLFMSGYSDEALLRIGFDKGTDAFLQKPFSGTQLIAAVREVLAKLSISHAYQGR